MSILDAFSGLIKFPVGNNLNNDEDDVTTLKKELSNRGYYSPPIENGIIDADMDKALRNFQKDNGLKVDGWANPGGETEGTMLAQNKRQGYTYVRGVKDQDVEDYIRAQEGSENFLYQDSRGNPTIGVGKMIPNEKEMNGLPLYLFDQNGTEVRPATSEEKSEAFRKLRTLPKGQISSSYDPLRNEGFKNIQLKDDDVYKLYKEELSRKAAQVNKSLPDLDTKPAPLQLMSMDMFYNLGSNFNRKKWPKLIKAYDKNDMQGAANEVNRQGVQASRNQDIKDILNGKVTIDQMLSRYRKQK